MSGAGGSSIETDAAFFCESQYPPFSHLAEPVTQAEHDFVTAIQPATEFGWVSLYTCTATAELQNPKF